MIPFILSSCFFLTACLSQSSIQSRYVADQGECQAFAERNIDRYIPRDRPISPADRNAEMVVLFSDCMGKVGWQVAKPKKADEVASTAPFPSPNYPAGYPSAAMAREPVPAAVAAPPAAARQPGQPVSTETTPMAPSGAMPPLNQPVNPPPAAYQPTYGTGPGRNF